MAKTDTQISVRITNEFKARLERQAEKERRSVSNLIIKVMEEYLDSQEEGVPGQPGGTFGELRGFPLKQTAPDRSGKLLSGAGVFMKRRAAQCAAPTTNDE